VVEASNGKVMETTDTELHTILAERARKLAQAPQTERQGNTIELVILRIGPGKYGVHLSSVDAIEHLRTLTPLPGLPSFWKGVVNLRGQLLPVLDLAHFLKLSDSHENEEVNHAELVVITSARLSICLLVDSVEGVQTIFVDDIAPPLSATSLSGNDFVSGSAPGLVAVLDVERLLADPALVVQDGMQ